MFAKVKKICYQSLIFMKFGQHVLNIPYMDSFYVEMVSDKDGNVSSLNEYTIYS